jgi:hypothetical protein
MAGWWHEWTATPISRRPGSAVTRWYRELRRSSARSQASPWNRFLDGGLLLARPLSWTIRV